MSSALHAVKITTNDGKEFNYTSDDDIAILYQCGRIDNPLRSRGEPDNRVVSLSRSDARCWQRIFKYLKIVHHDLLLDGDEEATKKKLDAEIAQLTQEELCMLLNGCYCLHAPTLLLESALDGYITNPELFLSAQNKNCQLFPDVQEMLDYRLAFYLRKEGINNSQKPITKISHFATMNKQPSISYFGEDTTYVGGFDDGTICIWDVASGNVLHKISTGTHKIEVLEKFNSEDKDYLAWTAGNKMHFWDIDDERLVLTLDASQKCFFCVKGYVFIADKSTGTISILDFPSDQVLQTFHHPGVTVLNISSSGDRLVTGSQDGNINIWNLESGALVKTLPHADQEINYLNVIDDDEDVLIVETDTKLYLYNITTQKLMYESSCNYSLHDDEHTLCAHHATIDLIEDRKSVV